VVTALAPDFTLKQKMIHIVGTCVTKVLKKYKDVQLNLDSETTRHNIAEEVTDAILRVIEDPKFK
tara:strand:- start:400 stop:594 length:195 start_codon:yes stop_codon:yes gene_type:complete